MNQLMDPAARGIQMFTRLPAIQRGIDAASRIIYPRGQMTREMMGRASAMQANSSADDVLDPNRPQAPGYDAETGVPWDINNQRPVPGGRPLSSEPMPPQSEEPRPLTIGPRHTGNSVPGRMSPEAILGMYRREFGMEPPQRSARDQFEQETGRDIDMQREAPPLPPRRPSDLPSGGQARPMTPMTPQRPTSAPSDSGGVLSRIFASDPYAGMTSRQMFQRQQDMGDQPGAMQLFVRAAAKQAEEARAARTLAERVNEGRSQREDVPLPPERPAEFGGSPPRDNLAERKAYGGAAGYSHGGYASGGASPSTASSGSGNSKDAALLKALEIIHHMLTRR